MNAPHADRLGDLLGLDEEGRLVLAELKRNGTAGSRRDAGNRVHGVSVSHFTLDTLAGLSTGSYLRKTDPSVTEVDALAQWPSIAGDSTMRFVVAEDCSRGGFVPRVGRGVGRVALQSGIRHHARASPRPKPRRTRHGHLGVADLRPSAEVDELVIGPASVASGNEINERNVHEVRRSRNSSRAG